MLLCCKISYKSHLYSRLISPPFIPVLALDKPSNVHARSKRFIWIQPIKLLSTPSFPRNFYKKVFGVKKKGLLLTTLTVIQKFTEHVGNTGVYTTRHLKTLVAYLLIKVGKPSFQWKEKHQKAACSLRRNGVNLLREEQKLSTHSQWNYATHSCGEDICNTTNSPWGSRDQYLWTTFLDHCFFLTIFMHMQTGDRHPRRPHETFQISLEQPWDVWMCHCLHHKCILP